MTVAHVFLLAYNVCSTKSFSDAEEIREDRLMDVEMVKAIGNLWTLVLVLLLMVCVVAFRKQLQILCERLTKIQFKRGETEISLVQEGKEVALKPKPLSEEGIASEDKPAAKATDELLRLEPKTADEWEKEMVNALILSRDLQRGEEAFNRMQASLADAVKKLKNEAFYLWLSYDCGDASALPKLQDMAKQKELDASVQHIIHKYIGYCYQSASNFDKAIEAFEIAAQVSQTEAERSGDIVQIAKCLHNMKRQPDALKRIMHEIGGVTHADALSILYQGLASLYEQAKNHEFRAIALEKALEIKPNDPDLHFNAAYSYGQKEFHSLALFHYKTLLQFKPDYAMALNNMGVEYKSLDMSINSTNSFKKAIELNATLAMANLANQYLYAGFEEEASQILDKAKQEKEPHPNVGIAMSAISERKETESQRRESELSVASEQQRYILDFADAYFNEKPDCPSFSSSWRTSDGIEIEITQKEAEIEAYWMSDKTKYKIMGTVINRAATISIYKEAYVWSSKYEFVIDRTGYAYLVSDGQKLFIMTMKEGKHTFMELVRKS